MAAPLPIRIPIAKEPIKPTNLEDAHRRIQELHNTAFILKDQLDTVLQRLYTAGIP